jgi:hypothetical protein
MEVEMSFSYMVIVNFWLTVVLCRTLHLSCFCGVPHITGKCGTRGEECAAFGHAEL